MTDYKKLVEALRCCAEPGTIIDECDTSDDCPYSFDGYCGDCMNNLVNDAAAAIEDLQAQLPKRGKWILCGPVGWPKWKCSVCHSEGRGDYIRCPWCGAKMEVQDGNK